MMEPRTDAAPEKHLWSAVLDLAIRDAKNIVKMVQHAKRTVRDTELHPVLQARRLVAWFLRDTSREGSFVFICNVLDTDPSYVRAKLLPKVIGPLKDVSKCQVTCMSGITTPPVPDVRQVTSVEQAFIELYETTGNGSMAYRETHATHTLTDDGVYHRARKLRKKLSIPRIKRKRKAENVRPLQEHVVPAKLLQG